MQDIHHFIDGKTFAGQSGRFGAVFIASTGEQYAQVALGSADEVKAAIASAQAAFPGWAETSPVARARVMFRYKELIEQNMEKLGTVLSTEHGKVLSDAMGEVARGLENVEYACGVPELLKGEHSCRVGPDVDSWSEFQPLGVVAGISPSNFPAMVPLWMYPMAIACGNTFVLKPSERDPSSALFVAGLLREAGLPDGVMNVVNGDQEAVEVLLDRAGTMPLPPYIAQKRGVDEKDLTDYQTMFAAKDGAVAAPTASLHFTDRLVTALDERGIARETLTLHVGAGTFLPVKADDTDDHDMHAEIGHIDAATAEHLNAVRAKGGRVIAVGTTVLRLLESAVGEDGQIAPFSGETSIFITPGYTFGAVDGLMTNFHLPKSTLMMLVSALMGRERMMEAYKHAIENEYRFYSYGDSSLLLP